MENTLEQKDAKDTKEPPCEFAFSTDETQTFDGRAAYPDYYSAALDFLKRNPDRITVWVGKVQDLSRAEKYISSDLLVEHILMQDDFCIEQAAGWPWATEAEFQDLDASLQKAFGEWLDRFNHRPRFYLVEGSTLFKRCEFPELAESVEGKR